jgi:hypothetical protein
MILAKWFLVVPPKDIFESKLSKLQGIRGFCNHHVSRKSHLGARSLSFYSMLKHILHFIKCTQPLKPTCNSTQGNFDGHSTFNFYVGLENCFVFVSRVDTSRGGNKKMHKF